ncbi:hypothetical protein AB0C14_26115 [Microbispora hainanensis]|uniref:hypothetical protein n=1 Tax=Microbispora hainanensis TaxID=568844 RepID=UPI0033E7D06E
MDDTMSNSSENIDLFDDRLTGTDITILPSWREGDVGVYREQLISLAKGLRKEGVTVTWFDDADHRTWYGERSAVSDAVIAIALGIITNAGWDAIKLFFSKRKAPVKLRLGYQKGEEVRWLEFEGNSTDVPNLLDKATPWQGVSTEIEKSDSEELT